jgi:hypothetical protein
MNPFFDVSRKTVKKFYNMAADPSAGARLAADATRAPRSAYQELFPDDCFFKPLIDLRISRHPDEVKVLHPIIWRFYLIVYPALKFPFASPPEWREILVRKRSEFAALRAEVEQTEPEEERIRYLLVDIPRQGRYGEMFTPVNDSWTPALETIYKINLIALRDRRFVQGFVSIFVVVYHVFFSCLVPDAGDCLSFLLSADCFEADVFWAASTIVAFLVDRQCFEEDGADPLYDRFLAMLDPVLQNILIEGVHKSLYFARLMRSFFADPFEIDEIPTLWTTLFLFWEDEDLLLKLLVDKFMRHRQELIDPSGNVEGLLGVVKCLRDEKLPNWPACIDGFIVEELPILKRFLEKMSEKWTAETENRSSAHDIAMALRMVGKVVDANEVS